MKLDHRIREAETRLFARSGPQSEEPYLDIASAKVRLRVLSVGTSPPLVMLHGVSLAAAVWAPLLADLAGYRALLVELPGHGLSEPVAYRPGAVRDHTLGLMDDLFGALGLAAAPVVAHSLGGMFALWYAAARPGRIASLVAVGDPAVALPGAVVRMPLSLLTAPVLGETVLLTPTPRPVYRRLLGQGLSPAAAAAASAELLDVLRFAARRSGNAQTVASLMHAIDRFRSPRADSVMTDGELRRISAPTMFLLGNRRPVPRPRAGPSRHRHDPRSGASRGPGRARSLAGGSRWLRQARDQPPHGDGIRTRLLPLAQAACGALRSGRCAVRIFIAGASGVIGIRLVPLLTASRHVVAGVTRSPSKASLLRELGALPVVCNVLDADTLTQALTAFRPDLVLHQLARIHIDDAARKTPARVHAPPGLTTIADDRATHNHSPG